MHLADVGVVQRGRAAITSDTRPLEKAAIYQRVANLALIAIVALLSGPNTGQSQEQGSQRYAFEARVVSGLAPQITSIPTDRGIAQPIAASRDDKGVQSDFLEGVVLLRPRSDAELQRFIDHYGAVEIRSKAFFQREADRNRQSGSPSAVSHVLRVDLSRADLSKLAANARLLGLTDSISFSSDAALRTFATT